MFDRFINTPISYRIATKVQQGPMSTSKIDSFATKVNNYNLLTIVSKPLSLDF